MKKVTRLLAFLLIFTMLFAMMPLYSFAASTALKGKTIIALGDSLTDYGGDYAYATVLGKSQYLGTPVINAGVGGDTTRLAFSRFYEDVLSKSPDVVTICLGMNDQACLIASGMPNTPFDVYREHLTYFANKLHEIDCDVIFVTPQPVVVGTGFYPEGGGQYGLDYGYGYMDDFCNIMREVALDTGSNIVDIFYECDFVDVKKIVSSDGIHQTNYGREQYAKYIAESMLAIYDGQDKATMTVKCVDENGKLLKSETISGKAGAHIVVPSPEIPGYSTDDADVPTTYVNGKTFTFTYSFALEDLVNEAMTIPYNEYGTKVIELVREKISEAQDIINDDNSTVDQVISCYTELKELLAIKGTENYTLSIGASYTATAPNRGDKFDDDGKRLTDGVKGYPDGREGYSGWNSTPIEVVVDLKEVTKADYFSVYCASSQWGINRPNNLTVSVSTDGKTYTKLGTQTAIKNVIEAKKGWDTSIISVVTDTPVDARYVKFQMNPNGSFVWIDEVEVAISPEKVYNGIHVSAINKSIETGDSVIFTPEFGTITAAKANHRWSFNVIAKWDDAKNAYVVTSATQGKGSSSVSDITLADDEILIATHCDETNYKSVDSFKKATSLKVGQELTLDGIDLNNLKREFASYIAITDYPEEQPIEGEMFWLTHFDNRGVEGAGTIFTGTYDGCEWWLHVAFKPVEGLDNVFEVVQKDMNGGSGKAKTLPVPEGGFVWACNGGNDYITGENDPTRLNYTNAGSKAAMALARQMQIGEQYIFSGLNLNTREVPTTTPHIDYFAPEYVCTARYALYNGENVEIPEDSIVPDNLAKDKSYTAEGIYFSNGVASYPDENGKSLTDGRMPTGDAKYNDLGFAGFNKGTDAYRQNGYVSVTVNLGASYCVDKFIARVGSSFHSGVGIHAPKTVSVYVSDDNETWVEAGTVTPVNDSSKSVIPVTVTLEKSVVAQYVQFRFDSDSNWIFVAEVEVYEGEPVPEPEEPTYILGDVNDDKKVDSVDYLLVKRACFNTYELNEDEFKRADVNADTVMDSTDYLLVKRIAFGTYSA